MAWEGRFLVVGFPAGIPRIPLNLALLKGCDIVGVFWGDWARREPAHFAEAMARLDRWYADGKLKPHISATFPLERAADALTLKCHILWGLLDAVHYAYVVPGYLPPLWHDPRKL